jgi:predicted nucleic acid-binding protein
MSGEVLADTNLLVYAYDRSEPDKQRTAVEALDRLVVSGSGVLSSQVLAEFLITVTRKLSVPLTMAQARERVRNYVLSWPILDVTAMIVLEAERGAYEYQLHYWDAQLWATAKLNQIDLVLTEDLPSAMVIEGVRFVNPFSDGFTIDDLL